MKRQITVRLIALILLLGGNLQVALADAIPPIGHPQGQDETGLLSSRHVVTAAPWLQAKRFDAIEYFLYQSPARIARYDLGQSQWLAEISLADVPTAFTVDGQGLYVGFGRRVSHLALDGTGETQLKNTSVDIADLFTLDQVLYIYCPGYWGSNTLMSINKLTGALIDSKNYWYPLSGLDLAPSIKKLFGRDQGLSPSDIVQVTLNADGTLGAEMDSPYHGAFPYATKTYVFPGDARVADNSGTVYNTNDLTYSNSLAGSFDDLTFYGNLPIVLRGQTLVAYSNTFLETGRYTPAHPPLKILCDGDNIFSFYNGTLDIEVEKIPVTLLKPGIPGLPVDPHGLQYVPDSIVLGKGQIAYILSRANLSIFRWGVREGDYLTTIPLLEAPSFMAYSPATNRLYLAYPSGKITHVKLDETTQEEPFANSPQRPLGLSTAGAYVFVCDSTAPWATHWTYAPDGTLISHKDWNYRSSEYIWSETRHKMYFFRDDTSPNDLLWEDIDTNGTLGQYQDSPYHTSEGWQHPIHVAPDGSIVLVGSGRIFDPVTLQQIDSLSTSIVDAAWFCNTLFTLRANAANSEIQQWGTNYGVTAVKPVSGTPLALFATAQGLLIITNQSGVPTFSMWDPGMCRLSLPMLTR